LARAGFQAIAPETPAAVTSPIPLGYPIYVAK
jgi:hypothetical protein